MTERGSERRSCVRRLAVVAAIATVASAQTKINLSKQARMVDFSGASSTKPSKAGTVLPASCSAGETFLKTDGPAGQNIYVCTQSNLWSLQGANIPGVTGFANMVLATDGTALIWKALGGDISGPPAAVTVSRLQGRTVSAATPSGGQALAWNGTSSQWEPQSVGFGQITGTIVDAQVGAGINATKIGAGTVGNTAFGYLANVTSDLQTQLNGKAASSHTHSAAGDASGSLPTLTVTGLQGRAIASTAPSNGQSLVWNSSTSQWQPTFQSGGVSAVFGRAGAITAQSGDYSFGQVSGTITDAQVGTGINAAKIGAGTVSNTAFGYLANVVADVQAQLNSKAATNQALVGDAGGTLAATTVTALRNRSVSASAPANGQTLVWNGTLSQWEPQNQAGGVPSVFGRTGAVTAQSGDYSFAQITGTVGDSQVSTGINANKIGGGTVSSTTFGYLGNVTSDVQAQLNGKAASSHTHTLTGDVGGALATTTVTALQNRAVAATAPANGQALVWNSSLSQWQPQNQASGVSSVNGRTGAVTAQTGDYAFSQISGTATDSQISTGINANKIGTGTVGNAAFGYLANVSSDLQAQLNGKASTGQAAAGDLSGTLGSPTVAAIQNRPVATTAPLDGQALVWNGATGQWRPLAPAGGTSSVFGRSGAVTAQTGDYSFNQIAGTVGDSQIAAGINANKIGGGTVTNTAFGYLASVNSDLQAQLNGKMAASQPAGGDLSGTLNSATVTALQNHAVASMAPSNGQALIWNSSVNQWQPQSVSGGGGISTLAGDVSGTAGNSIVGAIQNRTISTTPPTNGQVLTWNMNSNRWEPQPLPGPLNGSYSSSFVLQSSVTIPGAIHQLGTANLEVGCFDNSTPNMRVQPNTIGVDTTSYDVTITFSVPQTGRCVVTAGGASSGGGSGGAGMASQLGDFSVTWTSGSALTIGPNCSVLSPCNVRLGNTVYRFVSGTTVNITGGTGAAYLYIDSHGVLTVGHNLTASCSSPCMAIAGVTSFPANSVPLYTWAATSGSWDAGGGVDMRALLSGKVLSAGMGIVTLDTGSSTSISVDAAVVPTYLTATAALGFGTINPGTCGSDQTFSLPGAAVGDAVAPGWPGAIAAGLIGNMRVSAANTIAVRMCNFSGAAVNLSSATYRGTVVRNF